MPKRTSYDLQPAWLQMQERGLSKREVARHVGVKYHTGMEALFAFNGLLTWTDEDGKLHAYKEVEYAETDE